VVKARIYIVSLLYFINSISYTGNIQALKQYVQKWTIYSWHGGRRPRWPPLSLLATGLILIPNSVTLLRLTTCLENLEMSGNLTAVREMSGILLNVREKSCYGKVALNSLL